MRRAIAGLIAIAGVGAETAFMERTSGRCTEEYRAERERIVSVAGSSKADNETLAE